MYSRPFFSERRVYGSLFARVVALIDEISTKRIHIEEQIRGNVLSTSTCLRSQWFISHLVVLIIFETGDKCPNESRRIIPFVASVPFLFLPGKYALKNSSIVCLSCAAFYIFGILCLWKLGHVVIDFPYVVSFWFRQNFDQIESILYLFLYFFKYMFFSRF